MPADVLRQVESRAEANGRTVKAELVETLAAGLMRAGHLTPDPLTATDEQPAPGDIPLPGPSRVVHPKSAGYLMPDAPILIDGGIG